MRNHHQPVGQLSPDCAAIAALLPLLSDETLTPHEAGRVRSHLAGCPSCQAQQHAYARLDVALRRHFGPTAFTPLRTEEIMEKLPHTDSASEPLEATPPRSASALPAQHHPRRLLSGVASVAAVLVLALLAALIFASHARPGTGGNTTAPGGQTFTRTSLSGISMVSPDEGWAVGGTFSLHTVSATSSSSNSSSSSSSTLPASSSYTVLTGAGLESGDILLYHYQHGIWTRVHVVLHVAGVPHLTSISMDSPTDGWAVGGATQIVADSDTPSTQPPAMQGILLHYDGTTWKQIPSPIQAALSDVYMLSATNGWALTESLPNQVPEILHYDGATWTAQPLPASLTANASQQFLSLNGLTALADGEAWVTGVVFPTGGSSSTSGGNSGTGGSASSSTAPGRQGSSISPSVPSSVILHYTAGAWTVQAAFAHAIVNDIAMGAPDDGWAIGQDIPVSSSSNGQPSQQTPNAPSTLFLRYSAGHWARVAVAVPGDDSTKKALFTHISLLSPTDGWLIGMAEKTTTDMVISGSQGQSSAIGPGLRASLVFMHYDGAQWRTVAGPSLPAGAMPSIADADFTSPSNGWAVGSLLTFPAGTQQVRPGPLYPNVTPLLLHYANGVWSMSHL